MVLLRDAWVLFLTSSALALFPTWELGCLGMLSLNSICSHTQTSLTLSPSGSSPTQKLSEEIRYSIGEGSLIGHCAVYLRFYVFVNYQNKILLLSS